MKRQLGRVVQLVLLLVVGWFMWKALAPTFARVSWADLTRQRPDAGLLLASFAALVGVYVAHAFLWRRIMRDLGIGELSARETLSVYFVASLGRYVPGKVWQLAGMAVLAGRAGLPPVKATAAAVLGQLAFLLTGMLFLGVCLNALSTNPILQESGISRWLIIGAVALGVGSAALWVLVATPIGRGMREWVVRRAGAAGEKVRRAFELADTVRTADALAWAGWYAATWVALGVAFWLFAGAFVPGAMTRPGYLAGTIAASYLAGYVLPLPAGMGGREAFMVLLLQPVTGEAPALAISVTSRIWFTAAELVPLLLLPLMRTAPKQEESV